MELDMDLDCISELDYLVDLIKKTACMSNEKQIYNTVY